MKITDEAVVVMEKLADQYMSAARDCTGFDAIAFRERSYGVRAVISAIAALPHLTQGAVTVSDEVVDRIAESGPKSGRYLMTLEQTLREISTLQNPERLPGSHLTDTSRGQLAFAMIDEIQCRAREALASHEPAPTDTQERKELGYDAHGNLTTFNTRDDDTQAGLGEEGEVVAYGEVLSGKVETVRVDKSRHCNVPLVRQSDLTAERERWRSNSRETFEGMVAMRNSINEHIPMPGLESDLLSGPENSVFFAQVAEAVISALTACQQEVETLREGIKEIAERERDIRDNWTRFEAETGARILELETDLEIANDLIRKKNEALQNICELNLTQPGADELRWVRSDLIEQEIVFGLGGLSNEA